MSIADGQVSARVEGVATPSERSGFFSRDERHGGARDTSQGPEAGLPAAAAHGTTFHGVESEKPAAPANAWSATIERLAAEISNHARQGLHDRHEVSMRLEPPELGGLKIELSLDGDRLQARITAEVAETGGLIQTHLSELRQALQAHSLDLVNVQVDLGAWSGLSSGLDQGPHPESEGRKHWPGMPALVAANEGEASEHAGAAFISRGAVSVWA